MNEQDYEKAGDHMREAWALLTEWITEKGLRPDDAELVVYVDSDGTMCIRVQPRSDP